MTAGLVLTTSSAVITLRSVVRLTLLSTLVLTTVICTAQARFVDNAPLTSENSGRPPPAPRPEAVF